MQQITAGQLNRRIQLQTQSTAQDESGSPLAVWGTLYECWANIDVQESQRIYETAQFIAQTTFRITVRWTSSVIFSANQRIIYTEPTTGVVHTYEIKTVTNDKQQNRQILILAYELDGQE